MNENKEVERLKNGMFNEKIEEKGQRLKDGTNGRNGKCKRKKDKTLNNKR